MNDLKDYKVHFTYTDIGTTVIQARSKEEAEALLYEHLEEVGIPEDWKSWDREYYVGSAEER